MRSAPLAGASSRENGNRKIKLVSSCSDVNLVPEPVAHADAAVGDDSPLPMVDEDLEAGGNATGRAEAVSYESSSFSCWRWEVPRSPRLGCPLAPRCLSNVLI